MDIKRFLFNSEFIITKIIIMWSVAVFVMQTLPVGQGVDFGGYSYSTYGEFYYQLFGQPWRWFTSSFVHAGVFHLFFNMYWLFFFGVKIESLMKMRWYIAFVVIAGVMSSVAGMLLPSPRPSIGASGIVCAQFGLLYILRRERFDLRDEIPADMIKTFFIMLLVLIPVDLLGFFSIANEGHAGGLIYGIAIGYFMCKRNQSSIKRYAALLGVHVFLGLAIAYSFYNYYYVLSVSMH